MIYKLESGHMNKKDFDLKVYQESHIKQNSLNQVTRKKSEAQLPNSKIKKLKYIKFVKISIIKCFFPDTNEIIIMYINSNSEKNNDTLRENNIFLIDEYHLKL